MRFGMMVEEDAAEGVTGYIRHHLTHLTVEVGNGGFWALHLDSVFFNVLLATLLIATLAVVARRATVGVPGKFQAFVEIMVELTKDHQPTEKYIEQLRTRLAGEYPGVTSFPCASLFAA